jgi:hypothetical protein
VLYVGLDGYCFYTFERVCSGHGEFGRVLLGILVPELNGLTAESDGVQWCWVSDAVMWHMYRSGTVG